MYLPEVLVIKSVFERTTVLQPRSHVFDRLSGLRTHQEIKQFFAPELQERFFAREEFEDLTSLVGGGMVQAYYWFRPNQAYYQPAQLIAQIKKTLDSHDVDYAALLAGLAAGEVSCSASDELLAIMLGPGRLGFVHEVPDVAAVPALLEQLATMAGTERDELEGLLRIFAAAEHANICIADARCDVCEVEFCKRLRYR